MKCVYESDYKMKFGKSNDRIHNVSQANFLFNV